MPDRLRERHIVCLSCTATIDVSVLVGDRRETFTVQAVDELLVDYGWLPTTRGSYCPRHARSARNGAN